jgi:ribonuclease-3
MVQSPNPASESNDAGRLERCQQRLGYQFRDTQILESALTHASGADHRLSSNERLEFLGDAVLGVVVCEQLFIQFPDQLEGDLTKLKSIVVSRQTCAKISQALGLREFLVLGKGMTTHPAVPPSVLSDVLESALTHASGADHRLSSNERLEFLGDAVLGVVVCEQLFMQFPDQLEGDLTKL